MQEFNAWILVAGVRGRFFDLFPGWLQRKSHGQVVKDEGVPNARTPVAQENDYVQENVTDQ